ncbi:ABC transporter substrate-binding protein [Sulfitobacter pacificus]|uniref:ABC transporter substrate-binding protein n=1 Tax=Sulfitobacter pacificus TaxID=1499314 RepID=UPI003103C2D5
MSLMRSTILATMLALPFGGAIAETPDDIFVVAQNIDDIVAIDPAQAFEFTSGELVTNVYDRLVQYDAATPEVLGPGLASSWTSDADAKTITFTLREGATFHSGNPVRAEDVAFSLSRVIKLNLTPAFILAQLGWTPENVDSMITTEGNTVTLKYEAEFSPAFALNVIASRTGSIVDKETVMQHEVDGDMGNSWLNANSAGSGPFAIQTYRPGELIRLSANDSYFMGEPGVESIIVRHVAEAATQQLLLESGDVDMAKNLTSDQIGTISSDKIKVETFPQAAVHFLSFNQKIDSLTPPAVWDAARYLVNYEGMTNTFLKGQMKIHQAFWPTGFPGSYEDTPYSYDPAKATEILSAAGIETPFSVTLDVINAAPFTDMAQSLQAGFAEAGINLDIIPGTGSQVITKYRERSHEAMLLYWGPDFMDPHSNAKAFAYNSNNSDDSYAATTTWRNAWAVPDELNKKTMAAMSEADPEKRLDMYRELQQAVQEKSPIVIMFQAASQIAMGQNVSGYVNGAASDFVYYRLVDKD